MPLALWTSPCLCLGQKMSWVSKFKTLTALKGIVSAQVQKSSLSAEQVMNKLKVFK